ncbi:hypothetical protein OQI89_13840 [Lentilactobacillus diolivorans]|uniref:hypothetical protein n=1 Tax=Lentilactobacillus diolivorans TaxID=179838 RepID=UPI00246985A9|nr:hypothetical protein [Lentilactobacillus diolivorans]MDH5106915.1 hypothetical protein [Lentilactobacillus diolivorans]
MKWVGARFKVKPMLGLFIIIFAIIISTYIIRRNESPAQAMPTSVSGQQLNKKSVIVFTIDTKGNQAVFGFTKVPVKQAPVFLVVQYRDKVFGGFKNGRKMIFNLTSEERKFSSVDSSGTHGFMFGVVAKGQPTPSFGHLEKQSAKAMKKASIINYANHRVWYTFVPDEKDNLANFTGKLQQ